MGGSWMKKPLLSFILFCLLIVAAGCKTAPTDKTPEPTPVETAKASDSDVQTENKSETMQNSTTTAMPSNSETVEPKKAEPQKAETKTPTSTQAPAQKVTPRKTTAQSGSTAKNMPQAKNSQTKPAKQGSAQQKTAKSNTPGASAKKTDTSKQSATTTPSKAPAKKSVQKETPQKTTAQSGSASKNKTATQAKNTQAKPAKQEPTQQKTAKSKATAKNNKQSASPEAAKKETSKSVSAKQGTADKAAPAKQPESKKAEAKTKETAAQTAAAQITDISWMIEQADASFVSKQHKGKGKIFVTMLAKYKGDLTAQDFKEAFFASPADVWGIDEQSAKGLMEINKKEKLLMLKHLSSGEGEGAAALGKWFASVTLAGQKPFEKELNVTGIGGKTVMEKKATKETAKKKVIPLIVPTAKAENEQQALTMPVIQSVSRDADTIEIIFSINDSRVKNAYFYFDVPGEEYYRDSGSMIDATGKPVNGCRSFSTDGKKCQYVLRKDATNKDWFGKATQCFLVVSDVNRVASPWEERHRTISAASRITK
ncbi:hypothetical protein C5N99_02795 [Treponema medium]|nr:hypothetical protein C5N99_02795 [Treponema medium]